MGGSSRYPSFTGENPDKAQPQHPRTTVRRSSSNIEDIALKYLGSLAAASSLGSSYAGSSSSDGLNSGEASGSLGDTRDVDPVLSKQPAGSPGNTSCPKLDAVFRYPVRYTTTRSDSSASSVGTQVESDVHHAPSVGGAPGMHGDHGTSTSGSGLYHSDGFESYASDGFAQVRDPPSASGSDGGSQDYSQLGRRWGSGLEEQVHEAADATEQLHQQLAPEARLEELRRGELRRASSIVQTLHR